MAGLGLPDRKKISGFVWVLVVFITAVLATSIITAQNKKKSDQQQGQISKESDKIKSTKENTHDIDSEIDKQLAIVKKQTDDANDLKEKEEREKLRLEKLKENEINERVASELRKRSANSKADQVPVPSLSGSNRTFANSQNEALTPEELYEQRLEEARKSPVLGGGMGNIGASAGNAFQMKGDDGEVASLKEQIEAMKKSQDTDRKRYDNYVQMALQGGNNGNTLPGPVDSNETWQKNQQSQYEKDVPPLNVRSAREGDALYEGESVPCVTLAKINTGQPGTLRCQVSSDIYDSLTSQKKVIPAGSVFNLKYNAAGVAMGQTRVGVIATRLIRPDGTYVNLGSMNGADNQGQSGLEDEVDTHFWRLMTTSLLIAELTVAVQNQSNGSNGVILGQNGQLSYQNAAGQVLLEAAKTSMKPYEMTRPTLTIKPGFLMNIVVNRDIVF